MLSGAFDDRNDVRLTVKCWLRETDPAEYGPGPLRRLVVESVRNDTDPVDSLDASYREASYGALLGIVEFASEELERMAADGNPSLRSAQLTANEALTCLPHEPQKMRLHLEAASTMIRQAHALPGLATTASLDGAARALGAMSLASTMMRH